LLMSADRAARPSISAHTHNNNRNTRREVDIGFTNRDTMSLQQKIEYFEKTKIRGRNNT